MPYLFPAPAHIPLPTYGVFGIDPNQMVALPPFLIPQPAGVGSRSAPVPNLPALAGIPVCTQALVVQSGGLVR